jgi:hypothetical protein
MHPAFRMRGEHALSVLALGALLAPLATAQDSVSNLPGVAGSDSVDPYNTTDVRNDYVVDLTPFAASWGTEYAIGPIAKSSQSDTLSFFGSLVSAQGMSNTSLDAATFDGTTYDLWTVAGEGVKDDAAINTAPSGSLTPAGAAQQFSAAFSEFNNGYGGIVTAVVRHDADDPTRLYVSRIASAINAPVFGEVCSSSGFGSVDAAGNTYFRADDFGAFPCGTIGGSIAGNNLFRIDALARSTSALNVIDASGGSDVGATTQLLTNSLTTHGVPTNIPSHVAGRPVYGGTNFNGDYAYESSAGVLSTTATHRAPACDQRGNPCFQTPAFLGAGAVGTVAALGKINTCGVDDETRRLLIWGVDANGAVTGVRNDIIFSATMNITDNDDGHIFGLDAAYPTTPDIDEPLWHTGASSFRGGNGQIAIGQDQGGFVLISTPFTLDNTGIPVPGVYGNANPIGAIPVAKIDPNNAATPPVWTLAGYTGSFTDGVPGKDILDGPSGTAIGRMCTLEEATGGVVFGPSVAPPMIDSVGNVWFLSAVELFDPGGGASDFDNALLRAVYDRASFSYQLELVLQLGDVFHGQNSNTDYQIRFLTLAGTGGGVSPSTPYSGNIMQNALNQIPTAALSTQDAETLGGLVIAAEVVYDVEGDGDFVKVTGVGGDPTSMDQEYQVLLYIGARQAQGPQSFCDNADGSLASCPCTAGNPDSGCDNPNPPMQGGGTLGGVKLSVVVQQTTPNNRATLQSVGFPTGSTPGGVMFRNNGIDPGSPIVFGDGIRCVDAAASPSTFVRIGGATAAGGTMVNTFGHGAMAGVGSFYYQLWYRSTPLSYCDPTNAFNLSNGQSIVW